MRAQNIKIDHLKNPIGVDFKHPLVSWNCTGGKKQTVYEITACVCGNQVYSSGKVKSDLMSARLEYDAHSRERVEIEIALWDENGNSDEPSKAFYEMGLLDRTDWQAKWINPELEGDPKEHKPASYLRKKFAADSTENSRLYITCHGLYEAYINGRRVGDFVLAPGSYNYDKRLAYQTYDVSELVHTGENTIDVILGDGWFRSVSGVDGDRNLYGTELAFLCQLETAGKVICVSDETWEASSDGPIREDDMQQGEAVDLTIEEFPYHGVKIADLGFDTLICSNAVAIKEKERFEGQLITTPNGETVIDFGQNLAGYIEVEVSARKGQKLVLTTGETLDENGNFTQENFQDRKRHKEGGTKQMLTLICHEGRNYYKPKFTIWGFRYAKVETDIDLSDAKFTSIAVYSDMEETFGFECENRDLNKLVSNALWSMKSNFCDVPTDCPTRERAAWTGDMGVFIEAGLTMMDCYTIVKKWLAECRIAQFKDGKVANIAPRNNNPSFFSGLLAGSVGWGDAVIIVPYAMYKRTGDESILLENYDMMKKWYAFLEGRAKDKPLNPMKRFKRMPNRNYTIETGIDYGEWCEPDVESQSAMRTPQSKVATAYFARSGQMMKEIADILGKTEDATHFAEVASRAKEAFRYIATENGKIQSDRQAEYIRAITFDLLTEDEKVAAAKELNKIVMDNNYHLNTGFLSTPDLCVVLADYGFVDPAVKVLLNDSMPGWLYSVKKGATTIWEAWNGVDEAGVPHESLNHYSKGAVVKWLISGICGINVENGEITVNPKPVKEIGNASAVYDSPYGKIVSGYKCEDEGFILEIEIPANMKARLIMKDGSVDILLPGKHSIKY